MRARRTCHALEARDDMNSAVAILSMVAAIAAEAPYHLPRPAHPLPLAPAPPLPPRPQPNFIQYPPQPAPQFNPGPGYHYQQPNIAPAYVQPAHHYHAHPAPQPIPVAPQHPLISYPQQQYSQPQPQYAQPLPQLIPQAPQITYGQPQLHAAPAHRPALTSPVQPFTAPQPQPAPIYQPNSYIQPQPNFQQGYQYQQPHQDVQYTSQLPLQAQPLGNNAAPATFSSYHADSNQYRGSAQTHSEALDSTVVGRLQNIIKESEHTSARDAGYVSLVSGVSLESARPSIEISSFVHNSPVASVNSGASSRSQSSTATSAAAPSQDYGLPSAAAGAAPRAPAGLAGSGAVFLPQDKPATSYGSPQK